MTSEAKLKGIIVDLDGTLCDVDHRVEFVRKVPIDWKEFNDRMSLDKINHWCEELIKAMQAKNYQIHFVTGRGEDYRQLTEEWLNRHHIKYDSLLMRPRNDMREDAEIKEELYTNHIKGKVQILFVVDDRASVVKRWRELGLVCLQCDWGDF